MEAQSAKGKHSQTPFPRAADVAARVGSARSKSLQATASLAVSNEVKLSSLAGQHSSPCRWPGEASRPPDPSRVRSGSHPNGLVSQHYVAQLPPRSRPQGEADPSGLIVAGPLAIGKPFTGLPWGRSSTNPGPGWGCGEELLSGLGLGALDTLLQASPGLCGDLGQMPDPPGISVSSSRHGRR